MKSLESFSLSELSDARLLLENILQIQFQTYTWNPLKATLRDTVFFYLQRDRSMYLLLLFAGKQEVEPAGFQRCSAEIDEYFLQNRGPKHCSIQTMQQGVKWDFPCGS